MAIMRRLHLVVGLATVLAFVITGQVMSHHTPPMAALPDSTRLMFRSRHIYILASGLVNLMLGLYLSPQAGWRRIAQTFGGVLLLVSPVLLLLAFIVEPGRGFREDLPLSASGLFALFGGGTLHLVCQLGRIKVPSKA
jgi:hypothetical protein